MAWRAGQTGPLTFLSSFFKSPLAVEENDFSRQFQDLEAWAQDELRSVNGQIEYILKQAVQKRKGGPARPHAAQTDPPAMP